jgi:predicted DCC family thiol-disulfide oxidoreductase YuxK
MAHATLHQSLERDVSRRSTMQYPPYLKKDDKVVLFDGVCKLCNGWSQFLLKQDKAGVLKLCSVQSNEGQAILAWFGLPTDHFETMLYVDGYKAYQKSDAFLHVFKSFLHHGTT